MKIKLILFFLFILSGSSHVKAFGATLPDSTKYKWIKGEKFILHTVKPQETWNSISRKYDLRITDLMNANLGVIDLKIGQVLNIPAKSNTAVNTKKTESALPVKNNESEANTAIMYSVRSGETLFGISKKFGSSVDDVKKWNNLSDNVVHEGDQLIVSYVHSGVATKQEKKPEPIAVTTAQPEKKETEKSVSESKPKETKPEKSAEVKKVPVEEPKTKDVLVTKKEDVSKEPIKTEVNTDTKKTAAEEKPKEVPAAKKDDVLKEIATPEKNSQVAPPEVIEAKAETSSKNPDLNDNPTRTMIPVGKGSSGKTIMQVSESGVCSWITDADVNQNKFYGLHRTAPIGTIVKVTNKMNDKYVFVKIVGVLPDTGQNEKSIIKISQAAVNKVGALDAHFQVELSYGVLQ